MAETKTGFGNLEVKKAAVSLVLVSCHFVINFVISAILDDMLDRFAISQLAV